MLAILCFLAYGNMLGNELKIDDYTFYNDDFAQQFQSWKDFFTRLPDARHYFPLNYFIMIHLFHLTDSGPFPLYFFNLILFYLNCILLWQMVALFTKNRKAAFLTSALFCVHPMNSVIVNQSTLCVILVYALLMELSTVAFYFSIQESRDDKLPAGQDKAVMDLRDQGTDRWAQGGRQKFYVAVSLLAFSGSLLSFEGALLMPFYIMSILFFIERHSLKTAIKGASPFLVFSLLYLLIWVTLVMINNVDFIGEIKSMDFTAGHYLASMYYLIQWYLANFIYPADIVWIKNTLPLKQAVWFWNTLLIITLLGIGLLIRRWGKARSLEGFALVWLLIGFSVMPLAMLGNPPLGFLIEPYWFYFSSIGAFLLMALAVMYIGRFIHKRLRYVMRAVIILSLLFQTRAYNAIAKTEEGYCAFWLKSTPENPIPMMILAKIHGNRQEYDRAMYYYQKILDTTGYHAHQVHNFMAVILIHQKDLKEAKGHVLKAIALQPFYPKAHNTLGTLYVHENNYSEAEKSFLRAIKLSPTFTMPILNLADLYFITQQDHKAIELLEESLDDRSLASAGRKDILVKLALLHFKKNNPEDFYRILHQLLKADKSGQSILSLSYLMNDSGFKEGASLLLSEAIKIYPENPELLLFYGVMLCNQKKFKEGIAVWQKGLKLAPKEERFRDYIQQAEGSRSNENL